MADAGYEFKIPFVDRAVDEIENRFGLVGQTYPGHGEDGMEYAADFWSTDKAMHDRVFPWVIENGKRLGVWYVISWKRIYSLKHPERGIQAYTRYDPPPNTASQDHYNHVHVSFYTTPPEEEDMALSDADIDKVAKAVWDSLAVDIFKPPPGEGSTTNPLRRPKSQIEWLVQNIDLIKDAVIKP